MEFSWVHLSIRLIYRFEACGLSFDISPESNNFLNTNLISSFVFWFTCINRLQPARAVSWDGTQIFGKSSNVVRDSVVNFSTPVGCLSRLQVPEGVLDRLAFDRPWLHPWHTVCSLRPPRRTPRTIIFMVF